MYRVSVFGKFQLEIWGAGDPGQNLNKHVHSVCTCTVYTCHLVALLCVASSCIQCHSIWHCQSALSVKCFSFVLVTLSAASIVLDTVGGRCWESCCCLCWTGGGTGWRGWKSSVLPQQSDSPHHLTLFRVCIINFDLILPWLLLSHLFYPDPLLWSSHLTSWTAWVRCLLTSDHQLVLGAMLLHYLSNCQFVSLSVNCLVYMLTVGGIMLDGC